MKMKSLLLRLWIPGAALALAACMLASCKGRDCPSGGSPTVVFPPAPPASPIVLPPAR